MKTFYEMLQVLGGLNEGLSKRVRSRGLRKGDSYGSYMISRDGVELGVVPLCRDENDAIQAARLKWGHWYDDGDGHAAIPYEARPVED